MNKKLKLTKARNKDEQSGDLKSGHVWTLNGRKQGGMKMIRFLNGWDFFGIRGTNFWPLWYQSFKY